MSDYEHPGFLSDHRDAAEIAHDHVPHNHRRWLSEAEREEIANSDALELSAEELVAEHRGVSFNPETDMAMSWAERQDRDWLEWAEGA